MIDLVQELRDIERQIAALDARKAALRTQLENLTRDAGGAAQIPGVANLSIAPNATLQRYDVRLVNAVIIDMMATGDIDLISWAQRIAAARQQSERIGSLRVSWAKIRTAATAKAAE